MAIQNVSTERGIGGSFVAPDIDSDPDPIQFTTTTTTFPPSVVTTTDIPTIAVSDDYNQSIFINECQVSNNFVTESLWLSEQYNQSLGIPSDVYEPLLSNDTFNITFTIYMPYSIVYIWQIHFLTLEIAYDCSVGELIMYAIIQHRDVK